MALQLYPTYPFDFGNWTGPYRCIGGFARSGDVTVDVPYGEVARAIYIGGGDGTLSLVRPDGVTQAYIGLITGQVYLFYSIMINSSGTAATDIVWLS